VAKAAQVAAETAAFPQTAPGGSENDEYANR